MVQRIPLFLLILLMGISTVLGQAVVVPPDGTESPTPDVDDFLFDTEGLDDEDADLGGYNPGVTHSDGYPMKLAFTREAAVKAQAPIDNDMAAYYGKEYILDIYADMTDFRNDFGGFIRKRQIPVCRGTFRTFGALAVMHVRQVFRPEGEDVPIGMVVEINAKIFAENTANVWIGETSGAAIWLAATVFHREIFRMFIKDF